MMGRILLLIVLVIILSACQPVEASNTQASVMNDKASGIAFVKTDEIRVNEDCYVTRLTHGQDVIYVTDNRAGQDICDIAISNTSPTQ